MPKRTIEQGSDSPNPVDESSMAGPLELGSGGAHTHDFTATATGAPVGEVNPPYKKGIYIIKS